MASFAVTAKASAFLSGAQLRSAPRPTAGRPHRCSSAIFGTQASRIWAPSFKLSGCWAWELQRKQGRCSQADAHQATDLSVSMPAGQSALSQRSTATRASSSTWMCVCCCCCISRRLG